MRAQEITETTDYFRRREREEKIISGEKPARKKQPSQTSDYARRREQERKKEQGVAEATGNPGMPHDFTAVQPGAEVWYKGRFAGWTTGKVYDDPYGKHGKMVAFDPNPSEFPGDEGRVLSLPYDEVSLRKSTSIGKLKGRGVAEGIMKSLATRLVKGAANRQTPQEIANTHVRALNQRAPGTRIQGHPNFADFKREIHSYISAAQNGEQAFARTTDDHVKSLFKKYFSEDVAEGSGPKEKQKTPYRDINSPEYRKAADKQKQQMAKDAAAEPGKKLADKIAKKGVAEGF